MVSIITPCHNSSKFITQTIESVIHQTFQDWQLIIVDDFSTDDTVEKIYALVGSNPKVKIIALKTQVGAAAARNVALKNADGRYIAFLDSDDIWFANKLERQISFMISNNYSFTYTSYVLISEDGKELDKKIQAIKKIGYYRYLRNTIIGCLTVIIDKQNVGEFEMPDIPSSHDMALWLKIFKRGFYAYGLKEELACYRIVSNSNTAKKMKAAGDVWYVYRNIENLSLIFSTFCFIGYVLNAIKKRIL